MSLMFRKTDRDLRMRGLNCR